MVLFQKIRQKKYFSNSSGFSLIETIVVLMIISILTVVAIPKLEDHVRKSYKALKNYSQIGLNSLKNSGFLSKEFRLLQVKISIRSYLYAAKKIFISESYLPSNAADLNRFVLVNGCYLSSKQFITNNSKDCKPLSNKSNVSSWESENRLFSINMIPGESQLHILAIPFVEESKGIYGCYDSKSGIIRIFTTKGKNLKKNFSRC